MSQSNRSLSGALHKPVTTDTQTEIIHRLWRTQTPDPLHVETSDWTAYFSYYVRECKAALVDQGRNISARNHDDLLTAVHLLEDERTEDDVRQKLRQTLTRQRLLEEEQQMLNGTIRLAARLLLMVNIGSMPSEVCGKLAVEWLEGSLQEAVYSHFNTPPDTTADPKHEIVGSDLTCRYIEHVAGIEIVPTDNLADHLRLVDKDKKLCMFHHVTVLRRMKAVRCVMFPDGFIEETLDTLTLLLPDTDRKIKRWLKTDFQTHPLQMCMDRGLLKCGHFKPGHPSRRVEHYRFWRDRLEALRDAVEEATPPSKALLKALRDRKKGDRWLNSWVAIVAIGLTLFFGLVQSIEGAIQVYKAYHPETG